MTSPQRYGVRAGDDGSWLAKYDTLGPARVHTARLSKEAGLAHLVDFTEGTVEVWERGSRW